MAGGMDLGDSKGGKRALDAQINLVPFIDLMAVTICFLIMTAVWTPIGRLQVSQGASGGPAAEDKASTVPVTLLISAQELKLSIGHVAESMPLVRDGKGHLDLQKLTGKLREVRALFPDQQNIELQTEDAVRYDDLVHIIDACIGGGLSGVQVSPALG